MSCSWFRDFSLAVATALLATVAAEAAEIWTWVGTTNDVADPANWTNSVPGNLPPPPGVQAGSQFDRVASFGVTGSTTLTQVNENYWLEQFIFEPGAPAYTYGSTHATGYLSLVAPTTAGYDVNSIDNQSTNLVIINLPAPQRFGYDGYIKANAGGGDVVVNAPVAVADTSTSNQRFSAVTGSGNIYFNVDTSVHPDGNVNGGAWTNATITGNTAFANVRAQFWTDGLSGRAYLGNIGTTYRGTINLSSTEGGKVRLTHDNSLGERGVFTAASSTRVIPGVLIFGGDADDDPATGFNTTLELAGNIDVQRGVLYLGPRAGAMIGDTPHISNVSDNNTLRVLYDWNTMGLTGRTAPPIAGNWNIESQAGKLTIAGGNVGLLPADSGVIFNTLNVAVNLQLMGAGDGQIDAKISNWQSNPGLNIVKVGDGTWTLAHATNNYSGTTTIDAGTLSVTGGYTGTGAWTVNAGGALGGTGHIDAPVTLHGTLSPGTSPGTLTVNNSFTVDNGAVFSFELSTPDDLSDDFLKVTGDLAFLGGSNTLDVTKIGGGWLAPGDYLLVDAGSLSGTLPTTTINAPLRAGHTASIVVDFGASDIYLSVVPEPSTLALVGIGLFGLAAVYRRRRK